MFKQYVIEIEVENGNLAKRQDANPHIHTHTEMGFLCKSFKQIKIIIFL